MLVDVETFLFNSLINAQTMQFLDAVEQDKTTGSGPEVNNHYAKAFRSEESPTVTVKRAVAGRQQTRHQSAEDTTHTMY